MEVKKLVEDRKLLVIAIDNMADELYRNNQNIIIVQGRIYKNNIIINSIEKNRIIVNWDGFK